MIVIRPATRKDLGNSKEISLKLLKEETLYSTYLTYNEESKKSVKKWLTKLFRNKNYKFFVAEEDSRIVGMCFGCIEKREPVYFNKRIGYIWHIFVENDLRGKGIGKRLYEAMVNWFKSKGIKAVEVEIIPQNPLSRRFFERLGFREIMRRVIKEI